MEEKNTIFSGKHALLILDAPKQSTPRLDLVKVMRESGMLKRMKEQGVDFFVLGEMGVSELNMMDRILSFVSGETVKVKDGQLLVVFIQSAPSAKKNGHESPIVTFAGELQNIVLQFREKVEVETEKVEEKVVP